MQQRPNPLLIRLDPFHQVLLKTRHPITQDPDTMQHIPHHDRLKNIQLKLAAHPAHRNRHTVPHHLRTNHSQRLTLRRIHLARHDTTPRLVFGELQLGQSAARARAKESHVLGDFEEGAGEGVERTRTFDQSVVRGEGFEFVGGGGEGGAGGAGDFGGDGGVEAREGVQACADCCAALSEVAEAGEGGFDALDAEGELGDVAGEFLAEGQRCGVLEMGAPDFDDGGELLSFLVEGVAEGGEGGEEGLLEFEDCGDVHYRWEGVVGRGGHVDVVVGVDGGFGAFGAAEDFDGAVGDYFVRVHV